MSHYVRQMHKEDVAQVTEIDHESFPTQWPPPNYQHELRNRLAHYIVVCDGEKTVDNPEVKAPSEKDSTRLLSKLRQVLSRHRFFSNKPPLPNRHYIIGFTGFWVIADEAHITSIAVRQAYRRQGIGELLLISTISLATELEAHNITLEVRASNTAAQNLYTKYDFTQVDIRRGYYTDNREDGLLMSTQDIRAATFQTHFQQLKQSHSRRPGITLSQTTR